MVVQEATAWKSPPGMRGSKRKGRVYYATQAAIKPPTLVFFTNDPKIITEDYRRFMATQLLNSMSPSARSRHVPSGRLEKSTGGAAATTTGSDCCSGGGGKGEGAGGADEKEEEEEEE